MRKNRIYTLIFGVYECLKWGFMLKKGAWRGIFEKRWVCMMVWETAGTVVLKENSCDKRKQLEPFMVRIPAVCCFLMSCCFLELEFCVFNSSRVRQYVTDVAHTCQVHYRTFEAQTIAGVSGAAVFAQIQIPPVVFFLQTQFIHTFF